MTYCDDQMQHATTVFPNVPLKVLLNQLFLNKIEALMVPAFFRYKS